MESEELCDNRGPFSDHYPLDRLPASADESDEHARRLGERLKEKVFEETFPQLAAGFIAHLRERGAADGDPPAEALDQVFQGTLTLLYRLLFLLYAESRDLLPVKELRGYYEVSLRKLSREVAGVAGDVAAGAAGAIKEHYREDSYELYDRLRRLFQIIDKGAAALNVPFYNGGLFMTEPDADDDRPEARAARFLNETAVPDRFLARALDLLSRAEDEQTRALAFIDYRSLGVRQLGSIYEGLLEFKVRVAGRRLAVVVEKGREVYQPFAELEEKQKERAERQRRIVGEGQVYLENDRRERKAAGAYYTPDHIVRYVVERAVGPVLEEKFNAVRPRLREAQEWHSEMQSLAAAKKESQDKYDFGPAVELKWASLVDELFDIKVLDPAMGAGHFLVEAVDYIAGRMLNFLSAFPWNPVFAHTAYVRQTIIAEMEAQGITIDGKRLTDVDLLRRHVLRRCIYGVDLNPMAVELAKVALWLDCFTPGAPLSFLDHHLRCGNALLGVTVREVREAIEGKGLSVDAGDARSQFSLFGSRFAGLLLATDLMRHVGEMSDVTSAQAKRSRAEYGKAASALGPFKRVLDIYTGQWFANGTTARKRKTATQPAAVKFLKSSEAEPVINARGGRELGQALDGLSGQDKAVAEGALRAARERRFFHWELEFPEVFYGPLRGGRAGSERLEGGGFDAVVGNPPWGAELSPDEKLFFKERFQSVAVGVVDTFALFVERCTAAARLGGYVGVLLPDIVLLKNYPSARRYILSHHRIMEIVHWGQPFRGVNLDVCSIISARSDDAPDAAPISCIVNLASWESRRYAQNILTHEVFRRNEAFKFNLFLNDELRGTLAVIGENSEPLSAFLEFHEGIHSGNIRDKLFVEECSGAECRPLIFGGDEVQPFALRWKGRRVVYDKGVIDKSEGDYANLGHESYFTRPKLLIRRTGDRIVAAADYENFFASNNLFVAQPKPGVAIPLEFFEALLNSGLATWYFRAIQPRKGRLFSELKIVHLAALPVPRAALGDRLAQVLELDKALRDIAAESGSNRRKYEEAVAELNRIFVECAGLTESQISETLD